MVLRQCLLYCGLLNVLILFAVNSSGVEQVKEIAVTHLTKGQESEDEEIQSSGEKRFGEPIDMNDEESKFSHINENVIESQDISPEQELQMASMQDSSYQEANEAGVNGMSLDTLSSRTLEHSSTSDVDESTQDEDTNSYLTDPAMGNYSQGESEDVLQRQFIEPMPPVHIRGPGPVIIGHHVGLMRVPHPYPASIHLRLPSQVNVLPKMYNVHHYSPQYYPVRYSKKQSLPMPFYVPMKTGPDVEDTHLHVYHSVNPCENDGILMRSHAGVTCLCSKAYQGKFCDEKLYCVSNPCLNGGTCDEIRNNYRCRCVKGYQGYNCEERNNCALSPCQNDGTCVESLHGFRCLCRSGFTGEKCEYPNYCDPNPCKHYGTCVQTHSGHHECHCAPYYKGHFCETKRICYANPCLNGGKCMEENYRYPCECPHGYTPPYCREHVCASRPCKNGGKCVAQGSSETGWTHSCLCPLLYRGDNCETPNPCVTNPCLNGGSCIDSTSEYQGFPLDWNGAHLHYICVCPSGYQGPKCEDWSCSKCHADATCMQDRCVCRDGFHGDGYICIRNKNPCLPNPCHNNGTCTRGPDDSYDCTCPPGYAPPLCTYKDPCVPNPCRRGGTCLPQVVIHPLHVHIHSLFTCSCPPGLSPPDCNNSTIEHCDPNPCLNGGTCLDCSKNPSDECTNNLKGYVCKCINGPKYELPNCKCTCPKGNPLANPPTVGSQCDPLGEECVCPDTYTFSVKQQGCIKGRRDACEANPCQNNATCESIDEGKDFKCICPQSCTGKTCSDCYVCPDGYCLNGGECITVRGKPLCKCPPDFMPPRCKYRRRPIPSNSSCHPNPCQNGGQCHAKPDGYDCHCIPPFDGAQCQHDKCMDCDVNAKCILGTCKCRHGYIGSGYQGDCIKVKLCPVCPLYAKCDEGACACIPGYQMTNNQCVATGS